MLVVVFPYLSPILVQSKRQSVTGTLVLASSGVSGGDKALPLSPPIEVMMPFRRLTPPTTSVVPVVVPSPLPQPPAIQVKLSRALCGCSRFLEELNVELCKTPDVIHIHWIVVHCCCTVLRHLVFCCLFDRNCTTRAIRPFLFCLFVVVLFMVWPFSVC